MIDANVLLLSVRDVKVLVSATERFILEPDLIEKVGRESRRMAEERFHAHKVNQVFLRKMGL